MGQMVEGAVDPQENADGGNNGAVLADDPARIRGGRRYVNSGRLGFDNQLVGFA